MTQSGFLSWPCHDHHHRHHDDWPQTMSKNETETIILRINEFTIPKVWRSGMRYGCVRHAAPHAAEDAMWRKEICIFFVDSSSATAVHPAPDQCFTAFEFNSEFNILIVIPPLKVYDDESTVNQQDFLHTRITGLQVPRCCDATIFMLTKGHRCTRYVWRSLCKIFEGKTCVLLWSAFRLFGSFLREYRLRIYAQLRMSFLPVAH